jgi:hypothetical protein
MNIYKAMLLTIVEPVAVKEVDKLRVVEETLKADPDYWTVQTGELLHRALNFIEMSIAVAQERDD